MSSEASSASPRRSVVAAAVLAVAAGLIAGGCSSSDGSASSLACPSKPATAVTGTAAGPAGAGVHAAAGWT